MKTSDASQVKLRRLLEPITGREGWFTPAALVPKNGGRSGRADCPYRQAAGVNRPSRPVIAQRLDIALDVRRLTPVTNRAHLMMTVVFCLLPFALSVSVFAQAWGQGPPPMTSETASDGKPRMLEGVGIDQKLDAQLPLDLMFNDESGTQVRLGDYFGKRPVVLSLVYYNCPMLCNQVLNGLTGSMDTLSFDVGKEFEVVTVSFDPRETSELARRKKETYIQWYKRPGASEGWHFLTGDKHSIEKLTEAVGFRYRYDPATDQFAHASGIMLATSQGKLARYFYGIDYAPRDLKLGLIETSENKIGTPVDKLVLYCYHYDPAAGKYGPVVMNIIRVGGAATVIGFVAMLLWMRRRTAARQHAGAGGTL
jgi:protein SCO1/2